MNRCRLFVCYHYIARQKQQIYQGFENMICPESMVPPLDESHIEDIEEECAKHCIKNLGMDNASTKIINWRIMDGS